VSMIAVALASVAVSTSPGSRNEDGLWVREGYESTRAATVRGARFLELDDSGTLYVSLPRAGRITALRPADDGTYELLGTFVQGYPFAHGMHFYDGWLWFTTSGAVYKARDTDGDGRADDIEPVVTDLASGPSHWWRPVLVTPNGFYTSIGDSGNINDERDTDRQKIWLYSLDGKSRRLWSEGIRNTEKLRFRPGTDEIWGLDHGSDWFGRPIGDTRGDQPITDLNPPDELNKYVEGGFYGHPFVTGSRLVRYEYMDMDGIHELASRTIAPEWEIGAHWATNGFTFIDPKVNERTGALPADHSGDLFLGAHGSWNSSVKVGYCVARILFDDGKPYGLLKIVDTLDETGERVLGRPVDVIQAPDGSLLWSDDYAGRVYRLRWVGDQ